MNIRDKLFKSPSRPPEAVEALRGRRTILKAFAANGMAIPSICLLNAMPAAALATQPSAPCPEIPLGLVPTNGLRTGSAASSSQDADPDTTARSFADPVLELIRLLRNAADIEHATLLQYTYSAFSVKVGYESISLYDSNGAISLLTIAIGNMKRLGVVNRMLVVLGAPPSLQPPSCPARNNAYADAFELEPLSREALARYIYREAPQRLFDSKDIGSSDGKIVAAICEMIGAPAARAASIYTAIVAVADEVTRTSGSELPDITRWTDAMRILEDRDRESRFEFLRGLFLGSHPAFAGHDDVWRLPMTDPGYPTYDIVGHSTAYFARQSQGSNPTTLALIRLGNLQYGTTLLLLDLYFRHHILMYRSLAISHMLGPVRSVGKHLPRLGAGLPFEAIDLPDSSVLDTKHRLRFIMALLQEGQIVAEAIAPHLPPDYPLSANRDTMTKLREMDTRNEAGSAVSR
jgi:Ferritin-like